MCYSMTAFGRGSVNAASGKVVAELTSVNRKFLEMQFYLPRELSRFEMPLRKKIADRCARGQVTVRLFASFGAISPVLIHPNLPLAKQIAGCLSKIEEELNIPAHSMISCLNEQKNILLFEESSSDDEAICALLHEAVDQALDALILMKKKEGVSLANDLFGRLKLLRNELDQIEATLPAIREVMEKKLKQKIQEWLPDDDRLLREIVVLIDKGDITEEIIRLRSHFGQFEEWMEKGGGKTLEFLLQEMFREVNTIGSKCQDAKLSKSVVIMKSELEKMREQVQNIE